MEVFMWITLVGCAIAGLVFGLEAGKEFGYRIVGAIGGLVLGAIVGMLINIGWWLLSTFQEIRNYSKKWLSKHKTDSESPDLAQAVNFQKLLAPLNFLADKRKQIIISLISLALLTGIAMVVNNIDFSQKIKEKKEESQGKAIAANQGSFMDSRDRKMYKSIKIGSQTWMAENLNYAGTGECYNDNPANCQKYGKLFNWEEAKKVCPAGWHLPSNAEWDALYRFADGNSSIESPYKSETAGKKLKAAKGWNSYNEESGDGEDVYGFAALPGGSSYLGTSDHIGNNGYWWSASEHDGDKAYYRFMLRDGTVAGWNKNSKKLLLNMRCLKD
jgi:uncharacterized protein (TIGR02145 family)